MGFRAYKSLVTLFLCSLLTFFLSSCVLNIKNPLRYYLWPVETPPFKVIAEKDQAASKSPSRKDSLVSAANSDGNVEITLFQAILVGLENNKVFQVDKLKPPITSSAEEVERAAFDPVGRTVLEKSRLRSDFYTVNKDFKASAGVSHLLPTGTTLDFEAGTEWNPNFPVLAGSAGSAKDPIVSDWKSYTKLSVTQALLRGGGIPVNLANLRKARLDTQISLYELTGLAQSHTAEIELAYWEYFLALGRVHIYSLSLGLCRGWVKDTMERIRQGQKARSDIYFFQAQVTTTEQSLIDARSLQEKTRLRLLRFISPPSVDLWNRQLRLMTEPSIPKDSVEDLQDHILLASRMRPDINQAKLLEQKGELEIVRTKNGLLPKLDLFIQLGRTGYSKTFSGTLFDYSEGDGGADLLGRLKLEFPFLNRRAKAEYNRSLLDFTKQREALENLIQLAQQDVLLAYVEIHRAKDQMRTSSSLIKVQLEKRKAETEKYRLGSSTADKVAQSEKDTVTAELSALQARIDYLKGLTQFYVAEGSLLSRRGIGLVNLSH